MATRPQPPQLAYQAALVGRAIEELGGKWTLLILRDVAYLKLRRFGAILRNNPGLTPRVLSRRLRAMAADGLLSRAPDGVQYDVTPKGEDALQVLYAHLRFALRHHAQLSPGVLDPIGAWHRRRSTPLVRLAGPRRAKQASHNP